MSETQEVQNGTPATPAVSEVQYRVVADSELEILGPLFQRLGWPVPNPDMAKAIVAETGSGKDGLICGFGVVEFIPHVSSLWVDPMMRGTGIAEGLVEKVVSYVERDCGIKRYVCLAKAGSFSARLAEKYGMKRCPADTYMKQIEEAR